jgi:hypothetical protein
MKKKMERKNKRRLRDILEKNILNLVLMQDNARPDTAQQNERDHQD